MKNYSLKKKKILIFHHSGVYGGASASLIFLLNYLKKFYECTVVTPKGTVTETLTKLGVDFKIILGLPQLNNNSWGSYTGFRSIIYLREFFYLINFLFFLRKIKNFKPDIIHLNDFNILPLGKLIKIFYPKIKIFCHIRAVQNKKNSLLKSMQEKFFQNAIEKFICIDKDVLKSLGPIIKKKSKIIYNSFKIIKKKYHKSNTFHVGFVGNFNDSKGVETILDTAKLLHTEKNIRFILVGPIPSKLNFLEKILHILNLRVSLISQIHKASENLNNIQFLGFRENLDSFYNKIKIIVFPSYLNAAGRPVIEAAINGIPSLLALDRNVKNDLVKNNINGQYFLKGSSKHLAKRILKIKKNKKLYKKLSEECLNISSKKFSININGKKFREIIN